MLWSPDFDSYSGRYRKRAYIKKAHTIILADREMKLQEIELTPKAGYNYFTRTLGHAEGLFKAIALRRVKSSRQNQIYKNPGVTTRSWSEESQNCLATALQVLHKRLLYIVTSIPILLMLRSGYSSTRSIINSLKFSKTKIGRSKP